MKLSKIIGVLLIIISLVIGYIGVNKVSSNTKEVSFLGLEIEASNKSGKQEGFVYLGLGALLLVGGIYLVGKSKK